MTQEAKQRALDAFDRLVNFHKYENLVELSADEKLVRNFLSQPATPEGWKPI